MGEFFKLLWELLVRSFWGILVPTDLALAVCHRLFHLAFRWWSRRHSAGLLWRTEDVPPFCRASGLASNCVVTGHRVALALWPRVGRFLDYVHGSCFSEAVVG